MYNNYEAEIIKQLMEAQIKKEERIADYVVRRFKKRFMNMQEGWYAWAAPSGLRNRIISGIPRFECERIEVEVACDYLVKEGILWVREPECPPDEKLYSRNQNMVAYPKPDWLDTGYFEFEFV